MNPKISLFILCMSLPVFAFSQTETCSTKVNAKEAVLCLEKKIEKLQASQGGNLAVGQKLCRAVWGDHFSDGLVVPMEWTPDNCIAYAAKTGGPTVFLGCIFSNEVTFGAAGGAIPAGVPPGKPSRNCGW